MKKLLILTVSLFMCAALVIPVLAADCRIVDDAILLSGSERTALEEALDEISQRQGMDIVVVTVDSTGDRTPMAYADDFYDYGNYAPDGILLLVSMEDRDWWISTTGYGITAVTDAGLDYISDQFVPQLSDGDYYEAFVTFAQLCDDFITQARTGTAYDSHNLPKEPFEFGANLCIALVIGLVAALVVTGLMKRQLKSVRQKSQADDYIIPGSLQLAYARDLFLYTHLDRREKPQANTGSSTHMSSSGTIHGGGGGKF